jgi:hypothetical protein
MAGSLPTGDRNIDLPWVHSGYSAMVGSHLMFTRRAQKWQSLMPGFFKDPRFSITAAIILLTAAIDLAIIYVVWCTRRWAARSVRFLAWCSAHGI